MSSSTWPKLIVILLGVFVGFTLPLIARTLTMGQIMIVEPAARIHVYQEGNQVYFEFQREERPGSGKMVPATAISLAVLRKNDKQRVWFITSPTGRPASKIGYGVVPDGFTQYVPEKGNPPPLEVGVTYDVSVDVGALGATSFVYRGP